MNLIAPVHRIYTAFRTLFSGRITNPQWECCFGTVDEQREIKAKTEALEDSVGDGFYCIMTKDRCFNGSTTKEIAIKRIVDTADLTV